MRSSRSLYEQWFPARLFTRALGEVETQTLVRNSSWIFFSNTASAGLAFLKGVIVARILGVDQFGIYCQVAALVAAIQELLNFNVGTTLIKYGAAFNAQNNTPRFVALVKLLFGVSVVTALFGAMASTTVLMIAYKGWVGVPGLQLHIAAYCVAEATLFFDYFFQSLFRLQDRFKLLAGLTVLSSLIEAIIVIVFLAVFADRFAGLWCALIVGRLLTSTVLGALVFRHIYPKTRAALMTHIAVLKDEWLDIVRFTVANSLSRTVFTLMNRGDILVLGMLAGNQAVAYYSAAKRLAYTVLTATDPLANAVYPQLAKLVSSHRAAEAKRLLVRISKLAAIPAALSLVLGFVAASSLVKTVYGVAYAPASPSFCVLLSGSLLSAVFFWHVPLIQSLGLVRLRLLTAIAGLILSISIAFLLVPSFGALGSAAGLVCANIVVMGALSFTGLSRLSKAAQRAQCSITAKLPAE